MKTNGNLCPTNNSQFPECHCNDCIDNVIEYKGVEKYSIVIVNGTPRFVKSLCPLETCADFFYNNLLPNAPEICKEIGGYGWLNADEIKRHLTLRETDPPIGSDGQTE